MNAKEKSQQNTLKEKMQIPKGIPGYSFVQQQTRRRPRMPEAVNWNNRNN